MKKSPFVFVKNSTFYLKMLQFLANIFLPQLIKNTFLMHSSTFKTVNILVLEKNFKRGKKTQQLLFPKNERLILTMEQRKSL